jgi:hypothetical protein
VALCFSAVVVLILALKIATQYGLAQRNKPEPSEGMNTFKKSNNT